MYPKDSPLPPPNSYNVSSQLCDGKLDKLDGKTKFLERHKLSKMAQDSLDNLPQEIKLVILNYYWLT